MKLYRSMAIILIITGMATSMNAQIDTTGLHTWKQMYNSMAYWEEGAFGTHLTSNTFDMGWGIYNMLTHAVTGDSLFIIKLQDGSWKQLWIVERNVAGVYLFRYADLDGSNESEVELDMGQYTDKHFVYYNLRGDSVADVQPTSDSWDLVLTKYTETIINYTVTGFLVNDGVTVSVFNAPDSTAAADAALADTTVFTDSISAIGNSWYMLQGRSIVPLDTIAYFVKAKDGVIHKMQVTFFESGFSGLGRVGIRRQHFTGETPSDWTLDTLVMGFMYADEEFYSMADGNQGRAARNSWDIGFKSGVFTSSIQANTTMGVELYTYPKGDTSAWYSTTSSGRIYETGNSVSLYPVPVKEQLFVAYDLESDQSLEINIYDVTGKLLLQKYGLKPGTGIESIETGSLKPGIYMLSIGNNNFRKVSRFSVR